MQTVGIVDYQMGNLRSVQKAIERLGFTAVVSSEHSSLSKATHLILPGVGAFRDAISELEKRNLVPFLREWAHRGRPLLGICLGMQLFFDSSEEGGFYEGLGILPGKVVRFENSHSDPSLKIPHMGWNQVRSTREPDEMLQGISNRPFFYFVHSYYVVPSDSSVEWLVADYGHPFCAAVRSGNIMATQFHPEKSQQDGLRLLSNFITLTSS